MAITLKDGTEVALSDGSIAGTLGSIVSSLVGASSDNEIDVTGAIQRALGSIETRLFGSVADDYPRLAAARIGTRNWGDNPDGTGTNFDQDPYELDAMARMHFSVINGQPRRGVGFQAAVLDFIRDAKNIHDGHRVFHYIILNETGNSLSGVVHNYIVSQDGPPGQLIATNETPSWPDSSWYARDETGELEETFPGTLAVNVTDYVVEDNGKVYGEGYIDSGPIFVDPYVNPYSLNPLDGYYIDVMDHRPRENKLNYSGLGTHPDFSDARDNARSDWNDAVAGGGRGKAVAGKYRDGQARGALRIQNNYPGQFLVGANVTTHPQEYTGTDPTLPLNENGEVGYYTEYKDVLHMGWMEGQTVEETRNTGFTGMGGQGLWKAFGTPRMATNNLNYMLRHLLPPKMVMNQFTYDTPSADIDPTVGSNGVTSDTMSMIRFHISLSCVTGAYISLTNTVREPNVSYYDRTPLHDYFGLHNTGTTGLYFEWLGPATELPLYELEDQAGAAAPWTTISGIEVYKRTFLRGVAINVHGKPGGLSDGDPITGNINIPIDDNATDWSGSSIPGNLYEEITGAQDPSVDQGRTINETNFPSGYPIRRMDGRLWRLISAF